jgi:hypothetical protein
MFTAISIYTHLPIPLVIINCKSGDLPEFAHNLFLVDSVAHLDGQQTTLQHLIRRIANTIHNMSGCKRSPVQYPEK